MVLSDRTISEEIEAGRIVVDPLGEGCIQPASVDLRLDRHVLTFLDPERYSYIDVRSDLSELTRTEEIPDPLPYMLKPGQFILASTIEHVELPDDIVARLEGKSSLGRLGLLIHSTAGYVDPGWKGQLTLEVTNVAQVTITLYYGMKISQISFLRLSTPAEFPYGSHVLGSKYQGQLGPTATRSHLEFADGARHDREYPAAPTELKRWLDESAYGGSVARLASVLELPPKTVEDWVYGRGAPRPENRLKLYEVTGLHQYAPEPAPEQTSFLEQDGTRRLV